MRCRPTPVNAPSRNPRQNGIRFAYRGGMEGWVGVTLVVGCRTIQVVSTSSQPDRESNPRLLDRKSNVLSVTPPSHRNVVVTVTYVQESFSARGRRYSPFISFVFYSRVYNYVLAVANICHYRAVQASFCWVRCCSVSIKTSVIVHMRKVRSDETVRRETGRVFHARAAATGNARSPRLDRKSAHSAVCWC